MNRAYFSGRGLSETKMARALTLVEDATRRISALSIVKVRCYKLYTALYSRGTQRQIFSNTSKIGNLQGKDD